MPASSSALYKPGEILRSLLVLAVSPRYLATRVVAMSLPAGHVTESDLTEEVLVVVAE